MPLPINDKQVLVKFKAEPSLFKDYGDDYTLSYGYNLFVDEKGHVIDLNIVTACNGWLQNEIKTSMSDLRFEPAIKDGKPISSIHYVRYELQLSE